MKDTIDVIFTLLEESDWQLRLYGVGILENLVEQGKILVSHHNELIKQFEPQPTFNLL